MPKSKFSVTNVVEYRKKLGLSQKAFWAGVGVTASAASRYEAGISIIPDWVELLLTLRETRKVTQADIDEVAAMIKKGRAGK